MIIGITGNFGSGKTTVSEILKKYGFEVINADELYHDIYGKDNSLKDMILDEFGTLDRNKIKKIVFKDYKRLQKLNEITHPVIIKEIKSRISSIIEKYNDKNTIEKPKENKKEPDHKIRVALDVPLLIEAKMQDMADKTIVVKCDKNVQMERLLKKKKYSEEEITQIIKSQMPIEEKIKYADFVIDNSKTTEETERQIKAIILSLKP